MAQSTCSLNGTKLMANIWMHNGHLQVEGQKMSKSLGNFLTIREGSSRKRLYPGEVLRVRCFMVHYRQPLDWTRGRHDRSGPGRPLVKFSKALQGVPADALGVDAGLYPPFLEALEDDLNTPEALASLHALEEANPAPASQGVVRQRLAGQLFNSFVLLGLAGIDGSLQERLAASEKARLAIDETLVGERPSRPPARRPQGEERAEADRIRDGLAVMGIALKDAKNPATGEIETTWEIAR